MAEANVRRHDTGDPEPRAGIDHMPRWPSCVDAAYSDVGLRFDCEIAPAMPIQPLLDDDTLATSMAEIKPPLSPQEARIEATRCLYCFDAPCIASCPTGIDIPAFIKKIAFDNVTGAARTILEANILGASCARVCPTQVLCEGACVMLDLEREPIQIGRLQRFATDHVTDRGIDVVPVPSKKNSRRVAILGSGPAGLGCAAELARLGYAVDVYEKKPRGGGLNTYGIAYYKMKPEVSLAEVEMIERLGVRFHYGVAVGHDVRVADLEQSHDAIFIGMGLGRVQKLGIPGEDLPEVLDALDFIEQIHTKPLTEVPVGRRVAVLGCGNTAIDAVTQALRLGAKEALVIYRRGPEEMSAYGFEYELAKSDGAVFMFSAAPVAVLGGDGHVTGVRLARTEVRDGRITVVSGSEWTEPVDMVLSAVGQEKQAPLLSSLFPQLKLDGRGRVAVDPATMQTNIPTVFAGGDCTSGGREVVNAVAEGKKAARGIHHVLTGDATLGPTQHSRHGVANGPAGSGFDAPVRVHELEAALGVHVTP